MRCLLLVAICTSISGCSTYRPASIRATERRGVGVNEVSPNIMEGDTVRLVLSSGARVSGKILWLTDKRLAVDRGGNYDNEELVIDVSQIELAEIRDQSEGQIERSWFLSLGVLALISAFIGLHHMGLN